jgi:hypothetical protein
MAGEGDLQTQIMTDCKGSGILAAKVEAVGRRGFPDLLLIFDGVVVFMELKNPNGKGVISKQQIRWASRLAAHGGNVCRVDNMGEYYAIKERHYPRAR